MLNASSTLAISGLRKQLNRAFPSSGAPGDIEVSSTPSESFRVLNGLQRRYVWNFETTESFHLLWVCRLNEATVQPLIYPIPANQTDHALLQCYIHPSTNSYKPFDVQVYNLPVLAELVGRKAGYSDGYHRLATLKLWPAAHKLPLMEHVILTAMIVERLRLSRALVGKLKVALSNHSF
jgi:hypothetical protein